MSFFSEMSRSVGDPHNWKNKPNISSVENQDGITQGIQGFFDVALNYAKKFVDRRNNSLPSGVGPVDWSNSNYGNINSGGTYGVNTYWNGEKDVQTGNAWYRPSLSTTSIDPSSPGTPTADGAFGALEDPVVRSERMKNDAEWMVENMPHLYGGAAGAVGGMGAVVGGIQNAIGAGNSVLENVDKFNEGMRPIREKWDNEYGDNYFTNPNNLSNDLGSAIGSTAPIMSLSALMPGAAVAAGSRGISAALTRAGLGRLANSTAGKALIEDVARSPISTAADTAAEYGNVINELMKNGMSEADAREQASAIIAPNVLLDTATIPAELFVMRGAKGVGKSVLTPKSGESLGTRLGKGATRAGVLSVGSGLTEGYQEGAQTALENQVKGEHYGGGWYNPASWNDEEWQAARGGFAGGALLGIPGNVATAFSQELPNVTTDNTFQSTGNSMQDAVIRGYQDEGIEPQIGLAMAARESGGDDINAIHMADNGGIMQITEESARDYGVNEKYPNWRTDPYENARASAYILKQKIEEQGGDVWAGVRSYNGAGPEADAYLNQVRANYDNIGGIRRNVSIYNLPTQGAAIDEQITHLTPEFRAALPTIGGILNDMGLAEGSEISSAARTKEHNAEVGGAEGSYHIDSGNGGNAVDIVLPEGTTAEQAEAVRQRFEQTGAFAEVLFHDAGSGYHLHLGGYNGGLNSGVSGGAVPGSISSDAENKAFVQQQRELDREYDQRMRDIQNDTTEENAYQEVSKEMAANQQTAEQEMNNSRNLSEKEEIAIPEFAKYMKETADTIDDINIFWDMFTTDRKGQDKFIDTPENRHLIKSRYRDSLRSFIQERNGVAAQSASNVAAKELSASIVNSAQSSSLNANNNMNTPAAPTLPATPLPQQNEERARQQAAALNNQMQQAVPTENTESVASQQRYLNRKTELMKRVPAGNTERIHATADDEGLDVTYKVVPASDIVASHTTDYGTNPYYPNELQPRDRQRAAMQKQVEKMSKTLKPELLASSQFVNQGAPVIDGRGVVLNGNGRTMAIQKAYKNKNSSAKAYKQYLINNAGQFGLTPEQVQQFEEPVLVRQAANDADVDAIINSTDGGARLGAAEQAKTDADKLKLSTLELFVDNGTGEIMNPANRAFRRAAVHDIASDTDSNAMYGKGGDLTPYGADRVRNALFAKAYNDDTLLAKMSESTDNNSKNVMKAMIAAAPAVARVNEGIRRGHLYPDYDISSVIAGTANTIMSLRDAGKPLHFFLQETDLFNNSVSEAERSMLEFMDRNKFKMNAMADMYKGCCERIQVVGSPDQNMLFDQDTAPRITLDNIVRNSIKEVEGNEVQPQLSILEGETDERRQGALPAEPAGDRRISGQRDGGSSEEGTGQSQQRLRQDRMVESEAEINENQPTGKKRESAENHNGNAESGQGDAAKSTQAGQTEENIQSVNTGKALEQLLQNNNAPVMDVVNAATEHVHALLNDVADGRLSAQEADKEVRNSFQTVRQSPFWESIESTDFMYRKVVESNANAHKELQGKIASQSTETKKAANDASKKVETENKEVVKLTPEEKAAYNYLREQYNKGLTNKTELRMAFIRKFTPSKLKLFDNAYNALLDSTSTRIHTNGYGESTNREITSPTYKRAMKRQEQEINDWMDSRAHGSNYTPEHIYGNHEERRQELETLLSASEPTDEREQKDRFEIAETFRTYERDLREDVKSGRISLNDATKELNDTHLLLTNSPIWDKQNNDVKNRVDAAMGEWSMFKRMHNLRTKGGTEDAIINGAGAVAARPGERTNQNELGEIAESGRPGRSDGQGISSSGNGRIQPVGDVGVSGRGASSRGEISDSRIQTKKSNDSSSSSGSPELSRSVRDSLERVPVDESRRPAELVKTATNGRTDESNPVDKANKGKRYKAIRKEMPQLLPEQAGDVEFAEKRFIDNNGKGVLFTNGTGTGKTYTGLGIAKHFYNKKKKNILIVAPSDNIIKQWEGAAEKDFKMSLHHLESTQDSGDGPTIGTYANIGKNDSLITRDWDLIICDESQNLMNSESGNVTNALKAVRAMSSHQEGFERWFSATHREALNFLRESQEALADLHLGKEAKLLKLEKETRAKMTGLQKEERPFGKKLQDELNSLIEDISNQRKKVELEQSIERLNKELKSEKERLKTYYQGRENTTKVVFLSATPFAYVADVDYANGYLFDYGDKQARGYNDANAKEQFFIDNFGYRMRYNKLTKPDPDVDNSVMERAFHDTLAQNGALSGRVLTINQDYDRGFILVDGGIGKKIDAGFNWLWEHKGYEELREYLNKQFNWYSKMYLLEAVKAKESIPLIKEWIKNGKKVVVFHDYKKGGGIHPFKIDTENLPVWGELKERISRQYEDFKRKNPELVNLNMDSLKSPIELFKETFSSDELAIYNGDVSKKDRVKAQKDFNDDNGKVKVILVQSDAGQAGISLHDTTGKFQRVEINLGLPTRPVAAIQEEGRIYRVGNKSNAIFRYLNTGTAMEQIAFATKIAERASTAENLALGGQSRALKESFIAAYEESLDGDEWKKYLPGRKTEGTGGREKDYARSQEMSAFDKAKSYYFAQQKKTSSNKSKEGTDYYATPEPLGAKMVEWADSKANESMLEPSAGHGAIARWLPDNTNNVVVEPSYALMPKLIRATPSAKTINGTFEEFSLVNKFNGIVMNPPFGTGGKTAIEHLAKAFRHLHDGGRIVAIIPGGPATQKRFDTWFYGNESGKTKTERDGVINGVLRATINLPAVTFERAGTKVSTKVVIIDRYDSRSMRETAATDMEELTIDAKSINEFFDQIEELDMPPRLTMDERQYSIAQKTDKELRRSVDELKSEIKEAFPGAKNVEEGLNSLSFEMPNGVKIIVDMRDKIVVTQEELDRAKQEHGYNANDNIVVEGFAETHGKEAYIALSQGSRKGTGFHEAFHVVRDMTLTDKEKAVLDKYYKGDEEKQADAYAAWVEARRNDHGTLFGKLWRKVQDMAKKIQSVFTGVENVHNVFRKMERGNVWSRENGESEKSAAAQLKEDIAHFSQAVDDFIVGKLPKKGDITVMTTPMVMHLAGAKVLPIHIDYSIMDKIIGATHVHAHGKEIPPSLLKKLPSALTDPLMIIKSDRPDKMIVVVDLKDKNGATVIVPMILDVNDRKNTMSINKIMSVYGKGTPIPNNGWIAKHINNNDLLYINKKRTARWMNNSSVAPNGQLASDSFNLSSIIPDETDLGKLKKDNPTKYSIRIANELQDTIKKQDQKIADDAKKKFESRIEVAEKKKSPDAIGLHRTWLQSPSRIAEKKANFKPFFKMADLAMNTLTRLRADYARHLDAALNISKKDKETLQNLLWHGDAMGEEYSREELKEAGYSDAVIDSYWRIRNLMRKAYRMLNDARRQAKTKSGHFAGKKLEDLHNNKFVEILKENEQNDGSTLVTYKEYGNWINHYNVSESELKALENDDAIQILEKIPTKEGSGLDGEKRYNVTTREGIPDIHDRKGYIPHFFHEYLVRYVDSTGKSMVVGSGRNIKEATEQAIQYQKDNPDKFSDTYKNKIIIAPKVFDFTQLGMDESQYGAIVGDKEYYRMIQNIAEKQDMTLDEAKELLKGSAKQKGRHRFFGNFLQRKGAQGYEQDMEWVLRHYFNSASRYVALETEFKPKAISLFERLYGRYDNEYSDLPHYIKEYIADINGNPSTLEKQLNELITALPFFGKWVNVHYGDRPTVQMANFITNKMSIAKLGFFNVSSAMLNIFQLANTAAYTGNVSALWKALGKGAHSKYSMKDLRVLHDTNVLNDIGLDSGAGYGKFSAGKWANRSMILFKASEGIVRRGTVLAAFDAARKRGMSYDEAIQYAKDVNRKANFEYGVQDAPNVFRRGSIFSQLMLQFKKYPIKQLEVMKDMTPFFGKTTSKKQKAVFWGTYFAMAGLFQIPFANIVGLMVLGLTEDDPEKEAKKYILQFSNEHPDLKWLCKIALYGIGSGVNVDVSSRVGMGDAIPDRWSSMLGPTASTLWNVAKSMYAGDAWEKQIRNVSPGLGNLILAAEGRSIGKRGRTNAEYTSTYQRLLRGMGFNSTEESDAWLIQSILSNERSSKQNEKQALIDAYLQNPTPENAMKLKKAGIKASTVKAERKKKALDVRRRLESGLSKKEQKEYQYLLNW